MVLPRNLTQYLDEFIKTAIHTLTNLSLFPIAKLLIFHLVFTAWYVVS